ncbi:hypothetical protein HIM_02508 [Hirsutella minnesotensis 3608]|nr:hypothetical protein HIM_02508 [Hirsutella minnesotensis 3608]
MPRLELVEFVPDGPDKASMFPRLVCIDGIPPIKADAIKTTVDHEADGTLGEVRLTSQAISSPEEWPAFVSIAIFNGQ